MKCTEPSSAANFVNNLMGIFFHSHICQAPAQSIKPQLTAQNDIKGLVQPKKKILSVFTHPHVVSNLYVFICSATHKGRYLEECFNQTDLIPH